MDVTTGSANEWGTRFELFRRDQKSAMDRTRELYNTSFWTLYDEYLECPAWLAKRQTRFQYDHFQCQSGKPGCRRVAEQVHHLSYDQLGAEDYFELISVCGPCHEKLTYEDRVSRVSPWDLRSDMVQRLHHVRNGNESAGAAQLTGISQEPVSNLLFQEGRQVENSAGVIGTIRGITRSDGRFGHHRPRIRVEHANGTSYYYFDELRWSPCLTVVNGSTGELGEVSRASISKKDGQLRVLVQEPGGGDSQVWDNSSNWIAGYEARQVAQSYGR